MSVTVFRHRTDLSLCYPFMWNVTLEYTATHFNVLGNTRPGNPSSIFHTHASRANTQLNDAEVVSWRDIATNAFGKRVLQLCKGALGRRDFFPPNSSRFHLTQVVGLLCRPNPINVSLLAKSEQQHLIQILKFIFRRCKITQFQSTNHTFIIFHCHCYDTDCTMKERCNRDVTLIVACFVPNVFSKTKKAVPIVSGHRIIKFCHRSGCFIKIIL